MLLVAHDEYKPSLILGVAKVETAGLQRLDDLLDLLATEVGDLIHFFFNDTAPTEIYTLSLHDALPISRHPMSRRYCFPSKRTRSTYSMLRACASSTLGATALTASTRPPAVTSWPSAFRAVPAWKTKTPSSAGGSVMTSPVRGVSG